MSELDRRVEAFGAERMRREVARLRRLNEELHLECVQETLGATKEKSKKPGKSINFASTVIIYCVSVVWKKKHW